MKKVILVLSIILSFSVLGSDSDEQNKSSEVIEYTNQMLEEKKIEIENRKEAFIRKYKSQNQDNGD